MIQSSPIRASVTVRQTRGAKGRERERGGAGGGEIESEAEVLNRAFNES